MVEDFEWVFSRYVATNKPRWLVVDEVQQVMGDSLSPMGTLIAQVARHDLLGFIGMAQRIADVNKGFTSSCRMVILFQTSEVRDIIAVQDRWGKEIATAVQALQPCIYDDTTKRSKANARMPSLDSRVRLQDIFTRRQKVYQHGGIMGRSYSGSTEGAQAVILAAGFWKPGIRIIGRFLRAYERKT